MPTKLGSEKTWPVPDFLIDTDFFFFLNHRMLYLERAALCPAGWSLCGNAYTQEKDLSRKQRSVPDYRKNYAYCVFVDSTSFTRLPTSSVTKVVFKVSLGFKTIFHKILSTLMKTEVIYIHSNLKGNGSGSLLPLVLLV